MTSAITSGLSESGTVPIRMQVMAPDYVRKLSLG
jgi:hypothetical protein